MKKGSLSLHFLLTDVAYRINGGDSRYGRVEFTYDGDWHTICSNTWGTEESNVTCRQLGFVTGETYSGEYIEPPSGKAYSINYRCKGDESNLNDCPHEGFQEATYCQDHKSDEGVFCYTSVKLTGPSGLTSGNGSVLVYINDSWSLICDEGFNDFTATKVCKELGFTEGRAICCSALGASELYDWRLSNYSMTCETDDDDIESCLYQTNCTSQRYASAICLGSLNIDEDTYEFNLDKVNQGQIEVTHLGVKGRICSRDWDDEDAKVYCGSIGYQNGIAYQHSEDNVLSQKRGPYLLGGFECTGIETNLMDCPHLNRTNLDNCTAYDIASVLCYNETGIEYRLSGGGANYGRVEISVGGKWGTVCDQSWDNREAGVFCRQLGFTDGEATRGAHFGRGEGPIWISHLKCTGTEDKLHQCPHRGFSNDFSADWWFPLPCETHSDDAGVFCYKSVKLNKGPTTNAGGIEIHKSGQWYGVCDTGFDYTAGIVTCKSINASFTDARIIPGSAYGNISGDIMYSNVKCFGNETDLTLCPMDFNTTCTSGYYVSVYCSYKTIEKAEFKVRIHQDSLASSLHGIVEVRVNDVWGKICLHEFDDKDATVICQSLGYDGGVAYLHIMRNDKPILMRDVQCTGNEKSLSECPNKQMNPDLTKCNYGSDDAGVICYNRKDDVGFNYRLAGGENSSVGRVEIGYSGQWGMVCAWSWHSADARVLCRSLGYKDGIVEYTVNKSLAYSLPWVTGFFCRGDESTPMTCLNTGFNSTFLTDLCQGGKDPGAYTSCYNDSIEPIHLRLVDGPNNYSGRVEVYVTGVNKWGTICDDYWDVDDAIVVCRQLGYYGGTPLRKAPYGPGTGPIWFDNMKCKGNESKLFDCSHRGIGTHNCNHTEDVGVVCSESPPTTVSPSPKSSTSPTPSSRSTITTTETKTTTTSRPSPPKTTTRSTTEKKTTTKKKPTTPWTPSPPTTTSQKITTMKTTEQKTTSSIKTTSSPSKTTTNNTQSSIQSSQSDTSTANLGVAVGVPVAIIILLVIVIGLVIFFIKRRKIPSGYSRERFDDSVIARDNDGTVSASNQLYDLNLQPTSSITAGDHDNMSFGTNGQAYYSKGLSNGETESGAFTNPLYEVNKDTDNIEGVDNSEQSLPANGELTFTNISESFDDNSKHNSTSTGNHGD
ncbi:scavenger receptor [Mactra antiquata]